MSTPDAQDKKVPQFSSFTMRPAPAPAESCCTDQRLTPLSVLRTIRQYFTCRSEARASFM